MCPSGRSSWGEYPNTVLGFHCAPALAVDLRRPVGGPLRSALRSIGFEQSFGIITACNPLGVTQPDAVNDHLVASLQQEVAELGVRSLPVDACSADKSHCEQSLAVVLDQDSLIAIAVRYDQLAIFWFDGEAFWIVPARCTVPRLRLPLCE